MIATALAAPAVVPVSTAAASSAGAASAAAAVTAAGVATRRASTLSAEQRRATTTAHALGLDGREGLRVRDVVEDSDGSTHVRYDRTFAGLRVIGGDVVVHRTPSGAVRFYDQVSARQLAAWA